MAKKIKSVAERVADREKIKNIKDNAGKANSIAVLKAELQNLADIVESHINE